MKFVKIIALIVLICQRTCDLTDVPFDTIHDILRCLSLAQSLLERWNSPIWRMRELTHIKLSGTAELIYPEAPERFLTWSIQWLNFNSIWIKVLAQNKWPIASKRKLTPRARLVARSSQAIVFLSASRRTLFSNVKKLPLFCAYVDWVCFLWKSNFVFLLKVSVVGYCLFKVISLWDYE